MTMTTNEKPKDEKPLPEMQRPFLSEDHRIIGMRIDFYCSFVSDDDGKSLRKILKMSPGTFKNLKNGTRDFSLTELQIMANFFSTDVIKIVKGKF